VIKKTAKQAEKKAPAKKKLMKRAAAKKKVAKKTVAKKVTAKKVVAKKTPAKKSVVKETVAKKTVAKKTVVKRSAPKKATLAKVAPPKLVIKKPSGLPEKMRDVAAKILDERKAEDVNIVDVSGRSSFADYVIIATAQASRQVAAIAHYLERAFHDLGADRVRSEGVREGNWAIVDGGDVIVHLFRPEVRSYYNLDEVLHKRSAA
jgi:ribosome-associated protein